MIRAAIVTNILTHMRIYNPYVFYFSILELEQKEVDNLYQVQDHVLWILEPHRSSNVMVLAEPAITLLIL